MGTDLPATLADAIATEPLWLQAWIMILAGTHLLSVAFVAHRTDTGWKVRAESVAILVSFFMAAAAMGWLYDRIGYVRLLGAAHLVFWTPVYIWILARRKDLGVRTLFGKYLLVYLVVAGISLLIDAIDVVRHLLGDGELLHRWAGNGR